MPAGPARPPPELNDRSVLTSPGGSISHFLGRKEAGPVGWTVPNQARLRSAQPSDRRQRITARLCARCQRAKPLLRVLIRVVVLFAVPRPKPFRPARPGAPESPAHTFFPRLPG